MVQGIPENLLAPQEGVPAEEGPPDMHAVEGAYQLEGGRVVEGAYQQVVELPRVEGAHQQQLEGYQQVGGAMGSEEREGRNNT